MNNKYLNGIVSCLKYLKTGYKIKIYNNFSQKSSRTIHINIIQKNITHIKNTTVINEQFQH